MEPADKSHEIMSPPGLIGNEALDHEALNCRGPVLLDKVEEMPEVPPPPGLGDKVDEVLQGNSSACHQNLALPTMVQYP